MVSSSSPSYAPFSCTICFEPFHPETCYPVVLPCGHTFICQICAKRLERCMECRTSLFVPPPPPPPKTPSPTNAHVSIHSCKRTSDPSKAKKTPFPLPKNLLLLTLMETAEREARHKQEHHDGEDDGSCASEDGNKKVRSGIQILADSSCGTYEVIDKEGLFISPLNPTSAVVRFREIESFQNTSTTDLAVKMPSTNELSDKLNFRDKVQVVYAEDGNVTLARGRGFLRANGSQLVKVGSPLDKACEIEGKLICLSIKKKELIEQREDNKKIEHGLKRDLKDSLSDEVVDTVIARSVPISFKDDNPILVDKMATPKLGNEGHSQHLLEREMDVPSPLRESSISRLPSNSELQSLQELRTHQQIDTNENNEKETPISMTSPNSVVFSAKTQKAVDDEPSGLESIFGCVSSGGILGLGGYIDDDSDDSALYILEESIEVENNVSEMRATNPITAYPSSARRLH